jgi:signal transduction histidine kinase/ligand-binding sensor domain-containing protein/DNA-binding NarL/FixJ family response regulator
MRLLLKILLLLGYFLINPYPVISKSFYSVNAQFGISVRAVNSICKDNRGFIWASSKTGILRMTNDDYRIYQLPYETAGAITVRLVYENNALVAFSNNGQVFRYNEVADRFDLILNLGSALDMQNWTLYSLLTDEAGVFWIAMNTGLYRYSPGALTKVVDVSGEQFSIIWSDNQQIMLVSDDGIALYDRVTGKTSTLYQSSENASKSVSALLLDESHRKLWIGTLASGLFCFDFASGAYQPVLSSEIPRQPILALAKIADSALMLGIDGQGLWELNREGDRVLNIYKENSDDPNSLKGNGVYAIFPDPGKRVWVSTISGGVSYFELATPVVNQVVHQPNSINTLADNEVNGILEDSDGKLWFATNNGISCWNKQTGQWQNFYNNKLEQAQVFLSLCEDDAGRIWAGSYSSGFYILDQKTGRELEHYSSADKQLSTVSNFIFSIRKDSDGDLWIGGVNGSFISYQLKSQTFQTWFNEPVSSFMELAPGQILVGLSYGLSLLDKNSGEIRTLLSGLPVQDILVLDGVIWICTSGEGLIEYHYLSGTMNKYSTQSGLPSDFLNSIAFSDGYLWLGTESGICRFDPITKTSETFQSVNPLSGISYNKSAVSRLRNGQLVWGTNNGAVIFYPRMLRDVSAEGRIFFQDILISGRSVRDISSFGLDKPVDSLTALNLRYFQNTVHVEVLPVGVAPGTKFSWKLDGFDTEWNPPTSNRMITYTNLPSGRFTLMVRLLDNSMSDTLHERSMSIRVIPPYWRKSWFWILAAAVVIGMVSLYFLLYINRLKQRHIEDKVRFFTSSAHDIRTSLTLIKAPVEELSRETSLSAQGKYYLKLALDQTRHLAAVVTQLMDFQKADVGREQLAFTAVDITGLVKQRVMMFRSLAERKNIPIVFTSDCSQYVTGLDVSKMEKTIDNLISNAIKYSEDGTKIDVILNCMKESWQLQVVDQGIGFSKKVQKQLFREFYRGENAVNSRISGSGIGLLLVKKYVSLHGGEVSCESEEGVGSTFTLVVPRREISGKIHPDAQTNAYAPTADAEPDVSGEDFIREKHRGKAMHILIVEDNQDLLQFMQRTLSDHFVVSVAENGNAAWQFIRKQMPDLVVSDVMMPEMNGFELCRLLKSTYETSHIPVILLTALAGQSDQLHGLGLGADDYLTKPFEMNLLVRKIITIVRNRAAVREKTLKMIGSDRETAIPVLDNEHNDGFLRKIHEVVWKNMADPTFGKDDFAGAMNVSSSLLYKKIKTLTDLSPTEYVRTIRLRHAYGLLQSRKYTVTEVSEMCGFTSVGYFSTVFKKHFQELPSDL